MGANALTNRELASLVWLGVFTIWALTVPGVRSTLPRTIRDFLHWKLVLAYGLIVIWTAGAVYLGSLIGIWHTDQIKDTIIWFLPSSFTLMLATIRAGSERRYIRNAALSTLGLSTFLTFYFNVTTFRLWIELLIQPVLAFIACLNVASALKHEWRQVKRLMEGLLTVAGLLLASATAVDIHTQWSQLNHGLLVRQLALSVWLPIVVLPTVYLIALVADYESALTRLRSSRPDQRVPAWMTLALMLELRGYLRAVHAIHNPWRFRLARAQSFQEARLITREYRRDFRRLEANDEGPATRGADSAH